MTMMLTEIQAFFQKQMYRSRCTDDSIRSKEWIEMGVGRDITASGAAGGCTDFPDWSLCNDPLLHEDVRKL